LAALVACQHYPKHLANSFVDQLCLAITFKHRSDSICKFLLFLFFSATLKSIDYNVAMAFILNNNS